MKLVLASEERPPFFDGWKTDEAIYSSACDSCGREMTVHFPAMLDAAWSWREKMKEVDRAAVARVFRIDLANRSIAKGMDAVVDQVCSHCGSRHLLHFHFHEYRHSCYEISIRGIART